MPDIDPVDAHLVESAQTALDRLRHNDPALVKWILDGHPYLTEQEHLERFGEPYRGRGRKRPYGEQAPLTPQKPRRKKKEVLTDGGLF